MHTYVCNASMPAMEARVAIWLVFTLVIKEVLQGGHTLCLYVLYNKYTIALHGVVYKGFV